MRTSEFAGGDEKLGTLFSRFVHGQKLRIFFWRVGGGPEVQPRTLSLYIYNSKATTFWIPLSRRIQQLQKDPHEFFKRFSL
jgi:hypothetical protein